MSFRCKIAAKYQVTADENKIPIRIVNILVKGLALDYALWGAPFSLNTIMDGGVKKDPFEDEPETDEPETDVDELKEQLAAFLIKEKIISNLNDIYRIGLKKIEQKMVNKLEECVDQIHKFMGVTNPDKHSDIQHEILENIFKEAVRKKRTLDGKPLTDRGDDWCRCYIYGDGWG